MPWAESSWEKAGPIQRAVWEAKVQLESFTPSRLELTPAVGQVVHATLDAVRQRRDAGTLLDAGGKISPQTLRSLGRAGYWGLLVDRRFGGSSAALRSYFQLLTPLAALVPALAALGSTHGCLGAVGMLEAYGTEEQKARWLPGLAAGTSLSAFALTEPGAGSDITALRTVARPEGDALSITGEKLFITNAAPRRTIALVCLLDRSPAVVICDLPAAATESFRFRDYGLWALPQLENRGLVFQGFRAPVDGLLPAADGQGLAMVYRALNRGRAALCASAAGRLRRMMASLLPWLQFRRTHGRALGERELVRHRLGRLAALTVGCDALAAWCATLLDQGQRGELECIVAKVFASEALKEAAFDLLLRTHGGRALLRGHLIGDSVHDILAPTIYEGEGQLLGLAFFRALTKGLGTPAPEPTTAAIGVEPHGSGGLSRHMEFACRQLTSVGDELRQLVRAHGDRLPEHQCRQVELSTRVQTMVTMLVASLDAAQGTNETVRRAADLLCRDLTRGLLGSRPSDEDLQAAARLGESILAEGFPGLPDGGEDPVLLPGEHLA